MAGCPAPRHGTGPIAEPLTLEIGRDGGGLRGVAADLAMTFSATVVGDQTVVEARAKTRIAWSVELAGHGGVIAVARDQVIATLAGRERVAELAVVGEPGAALVALDRATGKVVWKRGLDASEYVIVTTIAGAPGGAGVVIGGTFGGTLRIGDRVVSSAGQADGFVARLDAHGVVAWVIRVGGAHADAVQGVAASATRIAIAGTFGAGAELAGQPLAAFDERSVGSDGFVAVLDGAGKPAWVTTFGGKADDAIAGVAFDGLGRVGVAGTVRDVVHVANIDVAAHGLGDALVAWWGSDGAAGGAVRIGGADFDGASGLVGLGDGFVVGGFFSGKLELGHATLTAGGGDDAFVAVVDPTSSEVTRAFQIGGEGREEIAALGPAPGGFVVGIAHTAAASFDGAALAAPKDPMSGAAIAVRVVGR